MLIGVSVRHGHWNSEGRSRGGPWPLWIFKIAAKMVVLLVSSGKKQISPLWDPPTKYF